MSTDVTIRPATRDDVPEILAMIRELAEYERALHEVDASEEHRAKARSRLEVLAEQHRDLSNSLAELLDDIFAGRKRLKVYFQFKMYNDPTLNPYLYQQNPAKR